MKLRSTIFRVFAFALVASAVLALSACASFPEPKSTDDTLLYVSVSTNELQGQQVFGFLRLSAKELSTMKIVKDIDVYANPEGKLVTGLPAGDYIIDTITFTYTNSGEKGHEYKVYLPFTMKPGSATILPYQIKFTAQKDPKGGSTSWMLYSWDKLKDADRKAVLEKLSKYDSFASWKID